MVCQNSIDCDINYIEFFMHRTIIVAIKMHIFRRSWGLSSSSELNCTYHKKLVARINYLGVSNLKICSLVLYERSLFFVDLRSVEVFEIGQEMKLRTGQENLVKKAIFWQFQAGVSVYSAKKSDCTQTNF